MKTTNILEIPNNLKYLAKIKMSTIYFCALVFCLTIIYFLLNYILGYLYLNHFNNLAKVISDNTIGVIRHMVIAEDYLSIQSVFTQTSTNELIDSIAVYSVEDIKLVEQVNNTVTNIANIQEIFTPIYWQDKIIGYLYLALNQKYLLAELQLATKVITTTILLILLVTFFILWLHCYITDKYILQAKNIFCQYFNKRSNPKNTAVVQLYSLASSIAKKDTIKDNNIIIASLVIKIKDKFMQNQLNKNNLTQLFDKINIIAVNCAKYCLNDANIINNNKHTTSIIANSNETAKNIVFCALVMRFLIEEIYSDDKLPLGIGICLLPEHINPKNKLQYLFSNTNKLAELSCENYVCISQHTINNIPTANINYVQHTNAAGALLIEATAELKHNIKQHAKNIKKCILQYR